MEIAQKTRWARIVLISQVQQKQLPDVKRASFTHTHTRALDNEATIKYEHHQASSAHTSDSACKRDSTSLRGHANEVQSQRASTSQAPGPYAMRALIACLALGRASFLIPAATGRNEHAMATTRDKTRACPKPAPPHAGFSEVLQQVLGLPQFCQQGLLPPPCAAHRNPQQARRSSMQLLPHLLPATCRKRNANTAASLETHAEIRGVPTCAST